MSQMPVQRKDTLSDIPQGIENSAPSPIFENGKEVESEKDISCCKDIESSSLNPTWIPPSSECNGSYHETDDPVFPPVPTFQLLQYASCFDIILTIIGLTAAAISGLGFPAMNYLFGKMTHAFSCHGMKNSLGLHPNNESYSIYNNTAAEAMSVGNMSFQCGNSSTPAIWSQCEDFIGDNFIREVRELGIGLVIIGALQFMLGYIMVSCLSMASENQVLRIRSLFLKSFLRQDVGWFDTHRAGEFASRTSDDLEKLKHGIGDKFGLVLNNVVNICVCTIHAMIMGWQLSLVLLALAPIVVIAQAVLTKADSTFAMAMMNDYAKAGSIAEEVLTSIRTVVAFGGESKEVDRYHKNLRNARKSSIRRSFFIALGTSIQWFAVFAAYALGFWYGVKLIIADFCEEEPTYVTSTVITVFFNISSASMFAPQLHPHLSAISIARSAAAFPFHVIKRIPLIDSQSTEGLKPTQITGNIKFENVCFNYPSRPTVKVLDNFTLEINRGETVALVGESGCGKSTTIQLIQRFYDVLEGCVKVDDIDIKNLNVGWLRQCIGVVGQEPVLFGMSILDNIRCGKAEAAMDEVVHAAQQANAHEFIMQLPQRYDTLVGERGAQLSGGQKQRIAIARALVRNPKILLLDEATSALDTENESLVQQALEKASAGRTTVIVAHRLSTIINADKIVVISKGRIVEMGIHDQLMKLKNYYYQLVKRQVERCDSTNDESDYTSSDDEGVMISGKQIVKDGSIKRIRSAKSIASKRASSVFYEKPITYDMEDDSKVKHSSLLRIVKMSTPEWKCIVIGMIGSIGLGFALPSLALIYGNVFRAFSYIDPDKALKEVTFGAELFLLVGAGVVLANTVQIVVFNISGENLTMRLRKLSFAAMLNQEMSWLDRESNSVGALCSKLSADASSVQGAIRSCAETLFHALCTLAIAVAISLYLNLKMGLVALSFMPFFVLALVLQQKAQYGTLTAQSLSLERANAMAVEAISNLRTVTSFHLAEKIHSDYTVQLSEPHKSSMKTAHIRGLMYGFAICVHYFSTAACMYYGSILTSNNEIKFSKVLATVQLVTIGSYTTGTIMALAASYNSAMVSAERIFKLLDRKPKIDSSSPEGIRMAPEDEVNVNMKKLYFNYENRPGATVLRGLDLNIPKGKCTALVGSSGCGKSTCIQMLERYYDPQDGQILIDGIDIRRYNIESLRSKIGIVSQEPVLFDRSIKENIAYGDNSRTVKMDEIFMAARKANIHSFVSSLPEGYETNVGDKGVQMSGGQKQRIAIARALIRNPHILLLDEATSALDAESEKIVQETLDDVQKGRTTIVIAHRLTTIKNADQIAVIYHGKVVEVGTHSELIERRGYYYNFYQTHLGSPNGANGSSGSH